MAIAKNIPILVTGGTGFVGSYLLRFLLKDGFNQVRALRRRTSSMVLVEDIKDQIDWVEGDIMDIFSLEEAMEGIQVIFHCAAKVSYDPRDAVDMMVINRDGTANIVNTALYMQVPHLFHVSSIAALGREKNGSTITESSKWVTGKHNSNYAISKYLAEQEAWRGMAEGLQVAVVNPAIILGAGNWEDGPLRMFKLAWKSYPFYPVGTSGFVDVRDVARFLVLLLKESQFGERYILSAVDRSFFDLQKEMTQLLGTKAPYLAVGFFFRELMWRLEMLRTFFFRKARPLITKETASHSSRTYFYDNQKSLQIASFQYTPFANTLQESIQLFQKASKENFAPKVFTI